MSSTSQADVADEWATVADEWRQRDDSQLRHLVTDGAELASAHLEALRDTDLFRAEVDGSPVLPRGGRDGDPRPEGGPLTAAVAALLRLHDRPGHSTSVALLVYLQALIIWEESDDLRQVRALAVALDRASALRPPPAEEVHLVAAVAEMCWSLLEQIQVENGVFCSCPIAAAEHAERTLAAARDARAHLEQAPPVPELDGIRYVIAEDLRVTDRYFGTLVSVADAVSGWIDDPPGSVPELTRAIAAAEAGVEDLEPDVFASELHAHQVALHRMREAADRPQLHLREGTIVYLYPFGLPTQPAAELVTRFLDVTQPRPTRLGGLVVEGVKAATLAGGWQQEHSLGVRNQAVVLHLTEMEIETTAATPGPDSPRLLPPEWTVISGVRPQVCLSSLGNHCLRIEVRMEDLELHSLDQAMRRIGRASGREILRTSAGDPISGGYLCDVAERIVADLRRFVASGAEAPSPSGNGAHPTDQIDLLTAAHVVLSARSLTIGAGEDRPECSAQEVPDVFGASVLLGPPRSSAGGFEWWIAQDVGAVVNLLDGKGWGSSLMVHTTASTVVYAPDLADWQTAELNHMAEHVASVSGALQAWSDHLGRYEALVAQDLDDVEESGDPMVIRSRLKELAYDASRARSMLGQLRPVNLCRNAAIRSVVEALHDASGVDVQEHGVHDGLQVLSAQQGRLAAEAERMRADRDREAAALDARIERRQASVQRRLELWLAVIGIVGLTSLADFLNNAHDVDGATLPWVEFGIILLVVLGSATLYIFRWRNAALEEAEEEPDESAWP